jgi:hypothetical protein
MTQDEFIQAINNYHDELKALGPKSLKKRAELDQRFETMIQAFLDTSPNVFDPALRQKRKQAAKALILSTLVQLAPPSYHEEAAMKRNLQILKNTALVSRGITESPQIKMQVAYLNANKLLPIGAFEKLSTVDGFPNKLLETEKVDKFNSLRGYMLEKKYIVLPSEMIDEATYQVKESGDATVNAIARILVEVLNKPTKGHDLIKAIEKIECMEAVKAAKNTSAAVNKAFSAPVSFSLSGPSDKVKGIAGVLNEVEKNRGELQKAYRENKI